MTDDAPAGNTAVTDVAILGAGPAGLSAALNLARARRSVLLLDANRPRNGVTLASHGFTTRDGVSPMELRRLGREELAAYPLVTYRRTRVTSVDPVDGGFAVAEGRTVTVARTLLLATGLTEVMPDLPSLRTFYGTSIHSCVACDGYEYSDRPIALIGETDDLADRALLLSQVSRDLIVFTNGVGSISDVDERMLAALGVTVDRRPLADVAGDRDGLTGIVLADGSVVPREAAFVRPLWRTDLGFVAPLGLSLDADGLVLVDADGRSSVPGVYAAGDCTPPGPQQLIVAAGAAARVAATITADLTRASVAALAPVTVPVPAPLSVGEVIVER